MNLVLVNMTSDTFTPTRSGTTGIITWEYCCAAKRMGMEPTVIARRQNADPYDWPRLIIIEPPYIPQGKIATFFLRAQRKLGHWQVYRQEAYASRLIKAVRKNGLEEANFLLHNDVELAVYLRQRFPKAYIVHHFQNQQPSKPYFRDRFKDSVNVAAGVSNFTSRWVEEYYGMKPGSMPTVYNGVDPVRFTPPANGSRTDRPIINFIGRTGIEKAPDVLLKAALKLSRKTTKFGMQILGSNHMARVEMDDYQKSLAAMADELESKGIPVHRPGMLVRADVPDQIRKAHIHVTPSRWEEPFGMVTLEGMACGLATIGSRMGGTPEVIGDAGLLFENESSDELADHLERLVLDAPLREDFAQRGRRRAEQMTWDAVWRDLMALFPKS